jgi:replicative DNA helicase
MDALRVQADQRRELWQRIRSGASTDAATVQELVKRSPVGRPTVAEEKLLALLLANEELRKIVLPRLENEDYAGLATAAIFSALVKLDQEESEVSFDSLSEATADESQASELLARLMMDEQSESFDDSLAQADSCLNALHLMKLDRRIEEISAEIAEADRAGDGERRDRLAMEKLELSKRRGAFLHQPRATDAIN